jgi:flagellar protein FlaJ
MRIYRLIPRKMFEWIKKQAEYSSTKANPEKVATNAIIIGVALAIIVGLILFAGMKSSLLESIGFAIVAFFVGFGGIVYLLVNAADSKGTNVEKILPDALQLIASNIKSGLTTERAMLESALPEFGALSDELTNTSKELLSGEKIEDALLGIAKKIKSNVVDRTIWLLVQGIKNGGQISALLLQMSGDLREENALKSQAKAEISMYVMLIFISAAFGAPILFGISTFIVGVFSEQTSSLGVSPEQMQAYSSQSPALGLIGFTSSPIKEDFIVMFSVAALIVTSIFSSLVLGVMSTGRERAGIKSLPLILIASLAIFFITRIVVKTMFGGMML